jgi:hypothetical protein
LANRQCDHWVAGVWLWSSYDNWIYINLYIQCLSPLKFMSSIPTYDVSCMWYKSVPEMRPKNFFDIWCLFFIKKCHKIYGPPLCHLGQWLNILLAQKKNFGPHFRHCIYMLVIPIKYVIMLVLKSNNSVRSAKNSD